MNVKKILYALCATVLLAAVAVSMLLRTLADAIRLPLYKLTEALFAALKAAVARIGDCTAYNIDEP